jgi:predicted kinase
MSEVAFLVMDLDEADEAGAARRLLNRYLELAGDYGGLAVLDLYKVYRAMVRAKVTAIRLGQSDVEPEEARRDRAEYDRYVALAGRYVRPHRARLILTHGVSGTGKTRLATGLRERLPLIHVRSDVERKRLFGLPAEARTASGGLAAGIYTPEAGERTYARLLELARTIVDAGYDALVDAAFLRADQRRPFLALAGRLGLECVILDLQAPEAVLRERVAAREAAGSDPSEAGIAVLEHQLQTREPLGASEQRLAVPVETARRDPVGALVGRLACE